MINAPPLEEFAVSNPTFLGKGRAVYRIGSSGPGVVVIHENSRAHSGCSGVVPAPVMSEPALPFPVPMTGDERAMHLSPAEQEGIRGLKPRCMALRFKGDRFCRTERFDAYEQLLGSTLTRIEIGSPDARYGIGENAHSVLTEELTDTPPDHPTWRAYQEVIKFLRSNLS